MSKRELARLALLIQGGSEPTIEGRVDHCAWATDLCVMPTIQPAHDQKDYLHHGDSTHCLQTQHLWYWVGVRFLVFWRLGLIIYINRASGFDGFTYPAADLTV